MSPRYIKCCNTWCDNSADRDGQPCPTCKQRESKTPLSYIDKHDENGDRYERRKSNNRDWRHGKDDE